MTTQVPFRARGIMVLVRYIERQEEKVGQIVIPGQSGAETTEAEILSVGPGTPDISTSDLHPGQRVLVRFRSGSGIQAPGKAMMPARELGVSVIFDGATYKLHTSLDVVGILAEVEEADPDQLPLWPDKHTAPSMEQMPTPVKQSRPE